MPIRLISLGGAAHFALDVGICGRPRSPLANDVPIDRLGGPFIGSRAILELPWLSIGQRRPMTSSRLRIYFDFTVIYHSHFHNQEYVLMSAASSPESHARCFSRDCDRTFCYGRSYHAAMDRRPDCISDPWIDVLRSSRLFWRLAGIFHQTSRPARGTALYLSCRTRLLRGCSCFQLVPAPGGPSLVAAARPQELYLPDWHAVQQGHFQGHQFARSAKS